MVSFQGRRVIQTQDFYEKGFAEKQGQGSNNLAEILGLIMALEHAVQTNVSRAIFQVDSKFVFGAITRVNRVFWRR